MDINQGSPFQFQQPNVNMGQMFSQGQQGLRGGGYPGGVSFGIAPDIASRQKAMQNAMFGMNSARNNMNYNLGLAGQTAQWNKQFNPTMMDYAGLGVAGMGALGSYGNRMNEQNMMQQFMLNQAGIPQAPEMMPVPGGF